MSRPSKAAAAAVVLLVAGQGAGLAAVRRSAAPAAFSQGGAFAPAVVEIGSAPPSAAEPAMPDPAPARADASTAAAGAVRGPAVTRPWSGGRGPSAGRPGAAPPTTAPPVAVRAVPARGTWTWAVRGSETVTGLGTRALPARMTMVVHGDRALPADASVLDIRYSEDHEERQVVRLEPAAWSLTYEAARVRYGAVSQSNESTYRPALPQVPLPLAVGTFAQGVVQVLGPDGSLDRVEDWRGQVVGEEAVRVGDRSLRTWKVVTSRKSRPGGKQEVQRERTTWFSPDLGMPVRYAERSHGAQAMFGFDFRYDSDVLAELVSHP